MAIGEPAPPETIDLVDWHDLYNHVAEDDAVIEGIAYRGRWTAIASPAKAGKSTVILALAVDAARSGSRVIYVDAEMGRGDVLARVQSWMHLEPEDLANLHYCDLPPKLDNVQGATRLWNTVEAINPDLVVIDGLNGVVNGAENDDTTWRDMYEWAISPLKQRGAAILSADNLGKAKDNGPRGSSVKLDKADAILRLERTDTGVKITATHRRSSSYPQEQEYAVTDADESGPPMRVTRIGAGTGYPAGTLELCNLLDELDAPIDLSRSKAQAMLRAHDGNGRKTEVVTAAIRHRRERADNDLFPPVSGTSGNSGNRWLKPVPEPREQVHKVPGSGVVPAGCDFRNTPRRTPKNEREQQADFEEPF